MIKGITIVMVTHDWILLSIRKRMVVMRGRKSRERHSRGIKRFNCRRRRIARLQGTAKEAAAHQLIYYAMMAIVKVAFRAFCAATNWRNGCLPCSDHYRRRPQ